MSYNIMVEKLKNKQNVSFRPRGNSMLPIIQSGNLCTLSPDLQGIGKGDIVFCKVKGNFYLHKISAIKGEQFQISNNKGFVNGWINKDKIFGKLISVESWLKLFNTAINPK